MNEFNFYQLFFKFHTKNNQKSLKNDRAKKIEPNI